MSLPPGQVRLTVTEFKSRVDFRWEPGSGCQPLRGTPGWTGTGRVLIECPSSQCASETFFNIYRVGRRNWFLLIKITCKTKIYLPLAAGKSKSWKKNSAKHSPRSVPCPLVNFLLQFFRQIIPGMHTKMLENQAIKGTLLSLWRAPHQAVLWAMALRGDQPLGSGGHPLLLGWSVLVLRWAASGLRVTACWSGMVIHWSQVVSFCSWGRCHPRSSVWPPGMFHSTCQRRADAGEGFNFSMRELSVGSLWLHEETWVNWYHTSDLSQGASLPCRWALGRVPARQLGQLGPWLPDNSKVEVSIKEIQCPFISPAAFHQKASQGEEPASCVQGDSKLSWGHSGQRGLLLTSLASGSLSRWVPPEQPQDAGPVA